MGHPSGVPLGAPSDPTALRSPLVAPRQPPVRRLRLWLAPSAAADAAAANTGTDTNDAPAATAAAGTDAPAATAAGDGIDLAKKDWQTRLDPAVIYRYDPVKGRVLPIPATELKPGHVYLRHVPRLGRHAWSLTDPDGSLRYAMGPGSVQSARQFDLRISEAERQREFESRAPELARRLAILGARPTVRLDDDGQWKLQQTPAVPHVFDLETGTRWEWHGARRTAVVHSGGNSWGLVAGRYRPAFGSPTF